jgi:hypothetical protein
MGMHDRDWYKRRSETLSSNGRNPKLNYGGGTSKYSPPPSSFKFDLNKHFVYPSIAVLVVFFFVFMYLTARL